METHSSYSTLWLIPYKEMIKEVNVHDLEMGHTFTLKLEGDRVVGVQRKIHYVGDMDGITGLK